MEKVTKELEDKINELSMLSVSINNDILPLIDEESGGKLFKATEKISEGIQEVLKYRKNAK